MSAPEIIRVVASAGSGKTYNLSIRYLLLLSGILASGRSDATPSTPGACGKNPVQGLQPESPAAILAITFTNKAAAEMKERILLILKGMALYGENPENLSIPPEKARKALFTLIDDFSDFNVMTIDAFMNTVLRAFAVEVGRLPDYELNFNPKKIYALTLDRLMARDGEIEDAFLTFLDHLLTTGRESGFNPETLIRKTLSDLKDRRIPVEKTPPLPSDFDETKEWEALRDQLHALYTDMMKIQEAEGCFKAGSFKPKKHLERLDKREFPNWVTDGKALASLVKKGQTCPNLSRLETRLKDIRKTLGNFFTRLEIHKFHRILETFRLTQAEESRLYQELNQFDGSKLPDKIQELLGDPATLSVPAAFCRLGERYAHYLIDEFQDTSQSQWKGMTPLIENSLSEGGTLFYVGDPKQAIYGWRGGDYKLMETAYDLMPGLWTKHRKTKPLTTNWRSRENLVRFFNALFDHGGFQPALSSLIDDPEILRDLEAVYTNSRQETRQGRTGGYIHARFLSKPEEESNPFDPVREAFFEALSEARRAMPDREILILCRKNDEIETIAGWLFEHPESIQFITEQSLKLFTLPPVKSLLTLLSHLAYPHKDIYLQALVHDRLFKTIPKETVAEIFSNFHRKSSFTDYFQSAYSEWDTPLTRLRDLSSRLSPYELTREIISHFRLTESFPGSAPLLERFLEQILVQEQGGGHLQELVDTFHENVEETHLVLPEAPDALRIMTIHKAKGLEAGVVILPFLDWSMTTNGYGEIIELEPKRYARLTRALCRFNPSAERKRQEIKKRLFIENFNLFYVALTRAREALYLLTPPRNRGLGIGDIFRELALHHRYLAEGSDSFTKGDPPCGKGIRPESSSAFSPSALSTPIRDIRAFLRLPPESSKETWLDTKARRMGTLVHAALSFIHGLPEEYSADEAAHRALEKAANRMGWILDEKTKATSKRLLTATLRNLKDFFTDVDEVWTEKEIVSKRGEIIRMDRLVRRGNEIFVLEFKTGREEPSHLAQVKRYLRVLESLDIGSPPRGILYYLETGEKRHV